MSQHPEEIRQEMSETRDSLTDKISMLEQHVVETVQGASEGVKETVEAVKDAVQETVETVKESFSITCQVKRHPWMMMAGSVGVGIAVGYLLNASAAPKATALPAAAPRRRTGNGSHRERFAGNAEENKPESRVDPLAAMFENELNQLKGLAIGALAGIVRDMVVDASPEMMRNPLKELINDFTTKFGGQPIPGRIFGDQEPNLGAAEEERSAPSGSPEPSSFAKRQTMTFPN